MRGKTLSQVLSFGLWLAVISRYKNSRMLQPTEESLEKFFTVLYTSCGMHTACVLYNGIEGSAFCYK